MDFAPLLYFLREQNMVPADVYLGTVQFGSETFAASTEVNFTVTSFEASMKATDGRSEGTAGMREVASGSGSSGGRPKSVGVRVNVVGNAVLLVFVLLSFMFAS